MFKCFLVFLQYNLLFISGELMAPSQKEGSSGVPIIVDLAFASNVRFLDDHELHLDNVELYKVTISFQ